MASPCAPWGSTRSWNAFVRAEARSAAPVRRDRFVSRPLQARPGACSGGRTTGRPRQYSRTEREPSPRPPPQRVLSAQTYGMRRTLPLGPTRPTFSRRLLAQRTSPLCAPMTGATQRKIPRRCPRTTATRTTAETAPVARTTTAVACHRRTPGSPRAATETTTHHERSRPRRPFSTAAESMPGSSLVGVEAPVSGRATSASWSPRNGAGASLSDFTDSRTRKPCIHDLLEDRKRRSWLSPRIELGERRTGDGQHTKLSRQSVL